MKADACVCGKIFEIQSRSVGRKLKVLGSFEIDHNAMKQLVNRRDNREIWVCLKNGSSDYIDNFR